MTGEIDTWLHIISTMEQVAARRRGPMLGTESDDPYAKAAEAALKAFQEAYPAYFAK